MEYQLAFTKLHQYDPGKPGISVLVTIGFGLKEVVVEAKLDCGSSFCVFERSWGEELGLDIERGHPERIGTVMGSFLAYGHMVTLTVDGFDHEIIAYFAAAESFNRNVLGRFGFLNRMVCGLNDNKGRLYLRRPDEEGD